MRSRRSCHKNRTPSQMEGGESSEVGAFERKPTKGRHDDAKRDGVGEERNGFVDGKEPGSNHRSRQVLGGLLGRHQHAVAVFERFGWHQIGDHGLQRRVVDGSPAGVDEHDDDQKRQCHPVAQDEERTAGDRHRTKDVRDCHQGATPEPVGERTRRERQEEPRKAVRSHHGGDGQRVGVDDDCEEWHRPSRHAVPRARRREADPEAGERTSELLPPDAVFRPAPDAHGCCRVAQQYELLAPRMGAGLIPSSSWRDSGGRHLSVKQINAKDGDPPCRNQQGNTPYRRPDGRLPAWFECG